MNNYKINCVGMSDEQKRLVQDAFFKLGYRYYGATKEYYNGEYYFAYCSGTIYRMDCEDTHYFEDKPHTEITLKELLNLANMEGYMTFTKAYLKDGMVVRFADSKEGLALVNAGLLLSLDGFVFITSLEDDLRCLHAPEYNIDEVYEIKNAFSLDITYWQLKSLWKRPDPISAHQQTILDLEAKQQELIEAAKAIASDIAKLKGN